MKRVLNNVVWITLVAALLCACSGYLQDRSGDLLVPEKVEEYQAVLFGEGYPTTFTQDAAFIDLMTDDAEVSTKVNANSTQSDGDDGVYLPIGRGAFSWAQDIEYHDPGCGDFYLNRYSNIMACNIIIENEETMMGDPLKVNATVAQAHALRALNYFYLINLYAKPYDPNTASGDPGVALRTQSRVKRDEPKRATVAQVYQLINQDLDRSIELFEKAEQSRNKNLFSLQAAWLLKSRIALFLGKWDEAIKYGEKLSEDDYNLCDLSGKTAEEMNADKNKNYSFISTDNPEVVFFFSKSAANEGNRYMDNAALIKGAAYVPSQSKEGDLINSYGEGDKRLYAFFRQDVIDYDEDWEMYFEYVDRRHLPCKHYGYGVYSQAFRTSEALLNVAEALVQRGAQSDQAKAIELLNLLRSKRIAPENNEEISLADFTQETLLQFVRDERRRELCFEEIHRWTDLRRYGMPRLEHIFYSSAEASPETYVLEQGDVNYTLELPKAELSYNKQIERTNRRIINQQ